MELGADEKVLWRGAADRHARLAYRKKMDRRTDAVILPVLLVGGYFVLSKGEAMSGLAAMGGALGLAVLIMIARHALSGPRMELMVMRWTREYAVTESRVLLWSPQRGVREMLRDGELRWEERGSVGRKGVKFTRPGCAEMRFDFLRQEDIASVLAVLEGGPHHNSAS
jgi:hypothetical protein